MDGTGRRALDSFAFTILSFRWLTAMVRRQNGFNTTRRRLRGLRVHSSKSAGSISMRQLSNWPRACVPRQQGVNWTLPAPQQGRIPGLLETLLHAATACNQHWATGTMTRIGITSVKAIKSYHFFIRLHRTVREANYDYLASVNITRAPSIVPKAVACVGFGVHFAWPSLRASGRRQTICVGT